MAVLLLRCYCHRCQSRFPSRKAPHNLIVPYFLRNLHHNPRFTFLSNFLQTKTPDALMPMSETAEILAIAPSFQYLIYVLFSLPTEHIFIELVIHQQFCRGLPQVCGGRPCGLVGRNKPTGVACVGGDRDGKTRVPRQVWPR